MNTLRIYPAKLRKIYEKNIKNTGIKEYPERYHNKIFIITIIITLLSSTLFYFLKISISYALIVFIFMNIFFYFKISLKASSRIKQMEKIFPDVISLMASNLRAGITIDRAFLLSARPEFKPLDQEILKTGKEIATGKDIIYALQKMDKRIDSEKISKVINLITSGLKAGGNISDLLEQTSKNMKEKEIIEKKAASSILMYTIFIFFAIGVGAPVLFGLSSILVEIIITLTSRLPDMGSSQMSIPFTFSEIAISVNFVIYFSVIFLITTDLISGLVIGLVNKGKGKEGLRFFIPLVVLSLSIFFLVRLLLSNILLKAVSFG